MSPCFQDCTSRENRGTQVALSAGLKRLVSSRDAQPRRTAESLHSKITRIAAWLRAHCRSPRHAIVLEGIPKRSRSSSAWPTASVMTRTSSSKSVPPSPESPKMGEEPPKKPAGEVPGRFARSLFCRADHISMSPMPPEGIAGAFSSFGSSATIASVVMRSPATDAAF